MYDNAIILMEGRIGNAKIDLVAQLPDDLEFQCEAMQIESLFSNLLSNAVDAVLMRKDPTSPHRIEVRGERTGKDLVITVKDNGVGIPDKIKNRIFEPFFTSKEVGKGMGLGLSLCHTVAKEHQIDLKLESKEGVGTTFKLKLPAKRLRAATLSPSKDERESA
jgi:signal transduction histidine kinase